MLVKLPAPLLSLLAVAALAIPGRAADIVDQGTFRVFWNDKPLGTELFSYETSGDSLMVSALVLHTPDQANGQDTLRKDMLLTLSARDQELRGYKSTEQFRGDRTTRGLVLGVGDTAFTSYYQLNGHGKGDRLVLPPGRMFVVDRGVFVLYDFICRSLHGKTFDQRPLTMFTLGTPDTLVEATAVDLGREAIPWGSKTVRARKLKITDPGSEFFVWIAPDGHMLRWSQPAFALRVEREAPAVKRRARPRAG